MIYQAEAFELGAAALSWLLIVGVGVIASMLVAFGVSTAIYGADGPAHVGRQLADGVSDTFSLSPRRIGALTLLTIREAVRRKALLVFVVFGILFMFGGWFLTNTNPRPELQVKVYVTFVLTALTWLVLPVVLLLSCWGLPEDIKARSLHTVVTKPARRNEIIIGRMLGFITVGTLVLGVMSAIGYIWIVRQVPEGAQQELICRVPVYGDLTWRDREGNPTDKGINTGDLWDFRGYIEGGTKARAIWTFHNITPDQMVEVADSEKGESSGRKLMLESRFQAFRTWKGNMDRSLMCYLVLTNEAKGLTVRLPPFQVREFRQNVTLVDRKVSYYDDKANEQRTIDLFDDLAPDGNLTVQAQCHDSQQFLGMAQPDLFIRTPDMPFASGYFKAVAGIWLMMVLVVILGVTASCFVKGPVATILTFTLVLLGTGFHGFLQQLVAGKVDGGGTIESVVRILDHKNPTVELDPSSGTKVIKAVDRVPKAGLWVAARIIPNLTRFGMAEYVANGFDVPFRAPVPPYDSALFPALMTVLAFAIPCLMLAYYSLKLRELEAK